MRKEILSKPLNIKKFEKVYLDMNSSFTVSGSNYWGGGSVAIYRGTATGKVTYPKYYPAGDYILRLHYNRQKNVTSCTTSFVFFYHDNTSSEVFYKDDYPNLNNNNITTTDFPIAIEKPWNSYQISMSVSCIKTQYYYMNLVVQNLRNY